MVRFHIGVNFLGGAAAAVDVADEEEEEAGFAVFVEVAIIEEELGTSFAVAVLLLLFEAFHEFAGGLSLTGLLDSELG